MSNLAPAAQNKLTSVKDLIMKCRPQIEAALPRHMTAERLARIAFSACQRMPKLLDCSQQSLALSIINAAELGCEPGLTGESYLVPYGNTCQLIIGYKGLMKLARNSGMVKSFQVAIVREGDEFSYERGSNKFLKHKEAPDNEESPITHVWAGAIVEGEFEFDVMTINQINKVRSRSRAKDSGPWVTDYEEMCKKTVIRRFCKLLPASPELSKAVTLDERADAGLPQSSDLVDLGPAEEVDPNETGAGASVMAKLTGGKKGKNAPEAELHIPGSQSDEFAVIMGGWSVEQQDAYEAAFKACPKDAEAEDKHATAYRAVVTQ